MKLMIYPNEILYQKCSEVNEVVDKQKIKDRRQLAVDMWNIMSDKRGSGLSAPQIGLGIRMFVWGERGFNQAIWNPVLSCLSGTRKDIEGCLSLPGINVTIERSTCSILKGIGMNGLPLQFIGNELLTRIWQHEIDHLDGKLIIDDMNKVETISNNFALKCLLNEHRSLTE